MALTAVATPDGSCHHFLSPLGEGTQKSPEGHRSPHPVPPCHPAPRGHPGDTPDPPCCDPRAFNRGGIAPFGDVVLPSLLCLRVPVRRTPNYFVPFSPFFGSFLHGQSPAAAMGQGESEPQEEAEVGNATAAGWGDGPHPAVSPALGLSHLSPQDASLTAVLPRLFADEQLSTGAVSTTNSSPRPRGQRPGPKILTPSVPVPDIPVQGDASVSLCPKGQRSGA